MVGGRGVDVGEATAGGEAADGDFVVALGRSPRREVGRTECGDVWTGLSQLDVEGGEDDR